MPNKIPHDMEDFCVGSISLSGTKQTAEQYQRSRGQIAKDHQQLIRDNIMAAMKAGDLQRANILRLTFAPLLAVKLD